MFLAEYYIYTLLYLVLLVRGVDIIVRLSLKFRLIPSTFIRNPITKMLALIAVFFGLTIIMVAGNKRYNRIVENEFYIQLEAKDAQIDSLTICFVADMHLNNFTSKQFIDDYVEHVSQIHPDIILYGGDMVESGRISEDKLKEFDKEIRKFEPVYGKYIVGGNHDNFNRNGYDEELELTFLSDTVIKIANSFYLMGLRYRSFNDKPIPDLKQTCSENLPVILLDHSPYQLEAAYGNGIDIQLSGHTHYGQVWPINYIIELMYELPWGYRKIENTHFFVTSGIQGWGTPIRTAARAEIMVIHVAFVD
jgi:predicted MPP superfamily phosphohydrolase